MVKKVEELACGLTSISIADGGERPLAQVYA